MKLYVVPSRVSSRKFLLRISIAVSHRNPSKSIGMSLLETFDWKLSIGNYSNIRLAFADQRSL